MSKAKIAVVNFETSGDKPANQEKMIDFITQAAEQGCDLIVFPEESLTGIGERGFAVASAEDKQTICDNSDLVPEGESPQMFVDFGG